MPDQRIFCNTPWYEIHIYWDGSYGICCAEDHKLYAPDQSYNVATLSLQDWFNSPPVRQFRQAMLGDQYLTACNKCYVDEQQNTISRRLRSNDKSVIFTRQAFDHSYQQSPGHAHFEHSRHNNGHTNTWPIDLHIDLGNFCNLACKMCNAQASSTIASQEVRWGIESSRRYLGADWTRDKRVWQGFLDQLLDIPQLQNIHFMGGETLMTDRVEMMVDHFLQNGRTDVCFSFVTNGTIYPHGLMQKLAKFKRVGMEVSIESVTEHNRYQRQGTDNAMVMRHIELFRQWTQYSHMTLTLRPVISALTIGYYHTLLEFALTHRLLISSLLCLKPAHMQPEILPDRVKDLYRQRFENWTSGLDLPDLGRPNYNASDPNSSVDVVRNEIDLVRTLLTKPRPPDSDQLIERLVRHCERWDRVYGLDAREFYPEFQTFLDHHAYAV